MTDTVITPAPGDSISVIIPVYNSECSLDPLVRRLHEALRPLTDRYEFILVNDGSRDGSWKVVQRLAREYPSVIRGFNMMRNYGQHNALLCGIRAARHDIIVTIDDDLQNPPEEIGRLLQGLHQGFDVVYGTPTVETHGFWRDLASRVTKMALQGAMGAETAKKVSAFRAFRTRLRNAFSDYRSPFLSIDVLLTWGTTRFASVQVRHDPRQYGVSNYTFRKLVTHAFNMMTGFSTVPLQLASWLGFVMTAFGLVILFYVLVIRVVILGSEVPGFPFLASIIAIFSGAQMFSLGIIGEYLARMHFRITERPTYVVWRDTQEGQT